MNEVSAIAERRAQVAGVFQVPDDRLASIEARSRVANQRAHAKARREQLAEDVTADETGRPG